MINEFFSEETDKKNFFDFENKNLKENKNDEETDKLERNVNLIEILSKIKNKKDIYDDLGIDDFEKLSKFTEISFILLRWMSAVGTKNVDWEEAKKQNRKKGDGKGAWPVIINDSNNTFINLILINEFLNKNFWDLFVNDKNRETNHAKLAYYILKTICKIVNLEEKEEYIWINNPKSKKNKNNMDNYEKIFLKLKPDLLQIEIDILKKKYSNRDDFEKFLNFCGLNA